MWDLFTKICKNIGSIQNSNSMITIWIPVLDIKSSSRCNNIRRLPYWPWMKNMEDPYRYCGNVVPPRMWWAWWCLQLILVFNTRSYSGSKKNRVWSSPSSELGLFQTHVRKTYSITHLKVTWILEQVIIQIRRFFKINLHILCWSDSLLQSSRRQEGKNWNQSSELLC